MKSMTLPEIFGALTANVATLMENEFFLIQLPVNPTKEQVLEAGEQVVRNIKYELSILGKIAPDVIVLLEEIPEATVEQLFG